MPMASLAEGPIALCEIQGYVFAARLAAADLAAALGHEGRAGELRAQAERLRVRFEESFWDEELGSYGIALDGDKRLCRVPTSNPGHCLWTGIASEERAASVVEQLLDDAMFSGWGIRTVAAGQSRYNPMSYHDGSIWPHDNAISALGMARYGHVDAAGRVMHGLFDASRHFDLARMPELFCGFTRRPGEGPTHYPVACSPAGVGGRRGLHAAPGLPGAGDRRSRVHGPDLERQAAGVPRPSRARERRCRRRAPRAYGSSARGTAWRSTSSSVAGRFRSPT